MNQKSFEEEDSEEEVQKNVFKSEPSDEEESYSECSEGSGSNPSSDETKPRLESDSDDPLENLNLDHHNSGDHQGYPNLHIGLEMCMAISLLFKLKEKFNLKELGKKPLILKLK